MSKYCKIETTFSKKSEAKKLAKILLEKKLAACTQIATIESCYVWNEKIVQDQEFLLSIKTASNLYKKVEKIILKNHEYEVPQIIMLPIENGAVSYFEWMKKSLEN